MISWTYYQHLILLYIQCYILLIKWFLKCILLAYWGKHDLNWYMYSSHLSSKCDTGFKTTSWSLKTILSCHRCYLWQKSACRVYYSYLRQAIHGRVTSEVNIAKMQLATIFLSIQMFGSWIKLLCGINVASNNCCVITFAFFVK